jgi:large subunit ribosomal protein L24
VGNRIKQGDTIEVVSGDDVGMQGTVQRVLPKAERILVAGINIIKKHQRPVRTKRCEMKAGVIEFEAPIHISNVMLVCPQCDQRTRVGFARQEDGRRVRVCKECGEAID